MYGIGPHHLCALDVTNSNAGLFPRVPTAYCAPKIRKWVLSLLRGLRGPLKINAQIRVDIVSAQKIIASHRAFNRETVRPGDFRAEELFSISRRAASFPCVIEPDEQHSGSRCSA